MLLSNFLASCPHTVGVRPCQYHFKPPKKHTWNVSCWFWVLSWHPSQTIVFSACRSVAQTLLDSLPSAHGREDGCSQGGKVVFWQRLLLSFSPPDRACPTLSRLCHRHSVLQTWLSCYRGSWRKRRECWQSLLCLIFNPSSERWLFYLKKKQQIRGLL